MRRFWLLYALLAVITIVLFIFGLSYLIERSKEERAYQLAYNAICGRGLDGNYGSYIESLEPGEFYRDIREQDADKRSLVGCVNKTEQSGVYIVTFIIYGSSDRYVYIADHEVINVLVVLEGPYQYETFVMNMGDWVV